MTLKILLVEDDPIAETVYVQLLEMLDCEVDHVVSGEAALTRLSQQDYDLILMDLRLPKMNGMEAARQIRGMKKGRSIPIVALTAMALFCVEEECQRSQINALIAKPLTMKNTQALLARYQPPSL